jgi:hypothetical protein
VNEIPFRAEAQAVELRQHQRNLSVAKHSTGGGNLTDNEKQRHAEIMYFVIKALSFN